MSRNSAARKIVWVVLWVSLGALSGAAQEIAITSGVADHQVFQRGPDSTASIALQGTAQGAEGRPVEARLVMAGLPVADQDWREAGKVQQGTWDAVVSKVPVGGPYRLEVRLGNGSAVAVREGLLVGDLWVLAGQSNMEGVGNLEDVQPPHPLVHSFDMTDQWMLATEPLHRLWDAVDSFHWRRNKGERMTGAPLAEAIASRRKGAGLGLAFASEMVRRTGVPVGLIPSAHGGTSMDQWSPEGRDLGGASLYGGMIRRNRMAGGKVAGVLWYQGESDANPKAVKEYQGKFQNLIQAVRRDSGIEMLPFYYVQIGRHVNSSNVAEWNQVQEAQRLLEQELRGVGMVASVDLKLDDGIHVGTGDLKRLGRRLAHLALIDLFPEVEGLGGRGPGPRPARAVYRDGVIRVEMTGVNGSLRAPGRIAGFSVRMPDGAEVPIIYRAKFESGEPAVLLYVQGQIPDQARLYYGYGKDPYCNVRDSLDMALPVFGPIAIE